LSRGTGDIPRPRPRASPHVSHPVVEGVQYLAAFGVVAGLLLLEFLLVTPGAIQGGNQQRDDEFLVLHGVRVALVCPVAVIAIDAGLSHGAQPPLFKQTGGFKLVAFHARLALRRAPGAAGLEPGGLRLRGKQDAQRSDDHQCQKHTGP